MNNSLIRIDNAWGLFRKEIWNEIIPFPYLKNTNLENAANERHHEYGKHYVAKTSGSYNYARKLLRKVIHYFVNRYWCM